MAFATQRLIAAFGDPQSWRFTGKCFRQENTCVCGQPIQLNYVWCHPDGRELITGSTCVTKVPQLDEESIALIQSRADDFKYEQQQELNEKKREQQQLEREKAEKERLIAQQEAHARWKAEAQEFQRAQREKRNNEFRLLLESPAHMATPRSIQRLIECFFACDHAIQYAKHRERLLRIKTIIYDAWNALPDEKVILLAQKAHTKIQELLS